MRLDFLVGEDNKKEAYKEIICEIESELQKIEKLQNEEVSNRNKIVYAKKVLLDSYDGNKHSVEEIPDFSEYKEELESKLFHFTISLKGEYGESL